MVRICAYVKRYWNFESLYLGNGSRYRDKTKRELNGMVSSIFWEGFDDNIFNFFPCFLHEKSKFYSWLYASAMIRCWFKIFVYYFHKGIYQDHGLKIKRIKDTVSTWINIILLPVSTLFKSTYFIPFATRYILSTQSQCFFSFVLSPLNRSLFYLAPTSTSLSVSTDVSTLFFLTPRTLLRFLLSTLKQIPLQFGWTRLVAQPPRRGGGKSPGREQLEELERKKGGGGRDLAEQSARRRESSTHLFDFCWRACASADRWKRPRDQPFPTTGAPLTINRPLFRHSSAIVRNAPLTTRIFAHDLSFWSFMELRMIYEKHL